MNMNCGLFTTSNVFGFRSNKFMSSSRWISSEQITTNQTINNWKQVEDNTMKLDHFNYFLVNEYITHPAEVTIIIISISDCICHGSKLDFVLNNINGSKSQKKYFQCIFLQ